MSNFALTKRGYLIGLVLFTSACSLGEISPMPPATGAQSLLRAMHLSPDAPIVDVLANGEDDPIASGVAFGRGSRYIEVPAGEAALDVVPAGGAIAQSVFRADRLQLQENARYTAVVYGPMSSLGAMLLEDDASDRVGAGYVRMRAIHTAAGVGRVDVWSLPAQGSPSLIYDNIDFGQVGPYLDLPVGAYELGIDVDDDASPELVFPVPSLAAGTVANIFVAATATAEVKLVAEAQDGTTAEIEAKPPVVEPPPPPPPAITRLRAIHLSPDAPDVDIYANGATAPAIAALAFGNGTGYAQLPAETYTFDIAPAGTTIANSVLRVEGLSLAADKEYTAVALGRVSSLRVLALEDHLDNVIAGNIRLRPIHAAPSVGQVDIWKINADGTAVQIWQNLDFGTASEALDIPATAYTLGIDADNDARPDLVFEVPALPSGTVANVYASEDRMGRIYLTAQFADGNIVEIEPKDLTPSRLRVIHLSPDAPSVSVYANDGAAPVIGELAFRTCTGFFDVPNGTYDFDVTPAGAPISQSVLSIDDVALEPGKAYTVAAIGAVAQLQALLLEDNLQGVAAGNIRVRAIHAAVGVGRVNVLNVPLGMASTVLYEGLDFGMAGNYLDIPAGAYRLGLDVNGDHHADLLFAVPQLAERTVANIFASADAHGAVELVAELDNGTVVRVPQH